MFFFEAIQCIHNESDYDVCFKLIADSKVMGKKIMALKHVDKKENEIASNLALILVQWVFFRLNLLSGIIYNWL